MLQLEKHFPTISLNSMNDTHKQELDIIIKLHAAAKDNDVKLSFELLSTFIKHTSEHFAKEEALMKEADFPDMYDHHFTHKKHVLDLQAIQSFFEMTNDTSSLVTYVEGSLSPWIIEHVEEKDSVLVDFLNK